MKLYADTKPAVTRPWQYKKFPIFRGRVGQSSAEFSAAARAFQSEMDHWAADIHKFNGACVHEIFYRFSDWRKDHPHEFKSYKPHG